MTRDTSIQAYNMIKDNGMLSRRRFQVYDVLFKHGPLTQNEAFKYISKNDNVTQQSIGPRFAELQRAGAIQEVGKTLCSITGNLCIKWDVTKKLPTKIEKRAKQPCPHCNGTGKIEVADS